MQYTKSEYKRWEEDGDTWVLIFTPYYEDHKYVRLRNCGGDQYQITPLDLDTIHEEFFWCNSLEEAMEYVENSIQMFFEDEVAYYQELLHKFLAKVSK